MNVSQIMKRNVETCHPDESLEVAAGRMWQGDVGGLPVVSSDGTVIGMITDRDVSMAAYTQGRLLRDIPVRVAMSKEVFSCSETDGLINAEETMRAHRVRRLPVVDATGSLAGIVSLNDLAREAEREAGKKGRAVSAQEVTATLAAIGEPRRVDALVVAAV